MVSKHTSAQEPCNGSPEATPPVPVMTPGSVEETLYFGALENSLGRRAALEVLTSFVGFARESMVELRAALKCKDRKQARALIGELNHSCRVVGAPGLLRACIEIEAQLEEADSMRIDASMAELARQTTSIGSRLHQLLS